MSAGTMRYWAAARAAAGVDEDQLAADTLAAAVRSAVELHGNDARLTAVLSICAYVVDGVPVGTRPHDAVGLSEGWVAEALPPFAGG